MINEMKIIININTMTIDDQNNDDKNPTSKFSQRIFVGESAGSDLSTYLPLSLFFFLFHLITELKKLLTRFIYFVELKVTKAPTLWRSCIDFI